MHEARGIGTTIGVPPARRTSIAERQNPCRDPMSTQLADRIAQFRKMAQDDPDNELGHFRLGQLLLEDNQFEEAARSFRRTLVLSPQFSKVYNLLAEARLKLDGGDEPVATLKEGYAIATSA